MTDIDPAALAERMRQKQEKFDQAKVTSGYSQDWPPDGSYQALIRRFDFFEPKAPRADGTTAYLKTEFDIANHPEHDGRTVETIHALDSDEGWRIEALKTHFDRLGIDVATLDLTELVPGSDTLQGLLDVPVEIAIKTSDQIDEKSGEPYRNLYVNKRLGDKLGSNGDVPAEAPTHAAAARSGRSDDEIPF